MTGTAGIVGIIGAGTMGAGIAQVATVAGWTVHLLDVDADTVAAAIASIGKRLERMVEKGRIDAATCTAARDRLHAASGAADLGSCDLVIEAIVEDLDIKARVLGDVITHLGPDAIIATNTSSLSVTRIGELIGEPARTVGMHFFNPAPIMKLVEVIAGEQTCAPVTDRVAEIAESWGKQVARAADVPGFIVNHVARPYYLEAFRILEDGYATADVIDDAMKAVGGFRMGPLELTDLIGQDVNVATTRSVWEQLDKPPLLHPSKLQEQIVNDGHLGRKTGRGVYDHTQDAPRPALDAPAETPALPENVVAAATAFVAGAGVEPGNDLQNYIFARILVAIIAQARLAEGRGVASAADIDVALKYGTNYPRGPFAWAEMIGAEKCQRLLDVLNATVDDGRFVVPDRVGAEG